VYLFIIALLTIDIFLVYSSGQPNRVESADQKRPVQAGVSIIKEQVIT
jgi:hypothetical protein